MLPESALNVPQTVVGITMVLKSLAVKRNIVYRCQRRTEKTEVDALAEA